MWDIDFNGSTPPVDPYERKPPKNRKVGAESMELDWQKDHPNAKKALQRASVPEHLQPGRGRSLSEEEGRLTRVSNPQRTLSKGSRPSPEATCYELQKNYTGPAKTAKGRAIQQDLQDLGDDFFGGVESRAPPPQGAARGSESGPYARYVDTFTAAAVPRRWKEGPVDTEGRVFDASDSNLLCMDVLNNLISGGGSRAAEPLCVVGSADHGLKVFGVRSLKEKKNLYTKSCGHTEWVTTCKFLKSGQVLSGGMDSKLCLWDSVTRGGPARCRDLLAHTGSISQVGVNDNDYAVSASYDRTLRIWNCGAGGMEVGCLAGHKAPVMQFSWAGEQVISGDRQGQAKIWDLPTASCLLTLSTKRGQIGALSHLLHTDFGNLTMFGDQGGVLTVLDMRQGKAPVFQHDLHPGGVLSGIRVTPDAPYVVTCGADRRILVLDPRQNYRKVHEWTDHQDFIYSMETFGSLVLSGASNGWLLVHDTVTGRCCYGLGANAAAVREIFAMPQYLVCAGDDGKASVYDFESFC